jgi:hypothetical protein
MLPGMDWKEELVRALSVDEVGVVLFQGLSAAQILQEKDQGRVFCFSQGSRNWEGTEVMGKREGRWLFMENSELKYKVDYVGDVPWRIEGGEIREFLAEGWSKNRSDYQNSRRFLVLVLQELRGLEDVPLVMQKLKEAGGGRLQGIIAFREALGLSLRAAMELTSDW